MTLKKSYKLPLLLLTTLIAAGFPYAIEARETLPILSIVDTRVGTDAATTATAGLFGKGSEEHGQTLPAVAVPNGMTFWCPQTRDTEQKCIAPYYYSDTCLQGFRSSHWLTGGCTQDYGSMTLMPLGEKLRTSPASRATLLDRKTETAHPDYYAVRLPEENLYTEMTGLSRSAIFRFNYDNKGKGWLVVNPNSDEGKGWIEVDPTHNEIRGYNPAHRIYQGWGKPTGFSGYFVIKLHPDVKVTDYGTFLGDEFFPGETTLGNASGIGVYIGYDAAPGHPVVAKVGTSFTSLEAAAANLEGEIPGWDFDNVRRQAADIWTDRFNMIEVEGGSDSDRAKFYSALYRASLLPRTMNDLDGNYPRFADGTPVGATHGGRTYYDDFSMWDTYRALHPLITLLTPEKSGDMMQSLVTKAEQGGWMPIFPCWGSYTAAMIGDHCASAIADATVKGIDNFDLPTAYRYLRKNAFESPATYEEYADGMGRRALESYLKYGYIPLEDSVPDAFHKREQTSRTLEYAYDDFALAQIASKLGHDDDYAVLMKRAQNYRNVIDPALGYANGRHADGQFASDTNPFDFNKAITEGAPCHCTWYAPQDIEGLIKILGGREKFVAKLDSMFTERRYWHGNEPCHQMAYLFDYAGAPEKTQKWVRHIMDTEYADAPGGLSGNEDAGQMSAWFVFSAMGFYPVCPGKAEYAIGSPLFSRITIRPEGGKEFTIIADGNSSENVYIESAELDGTPLDRMLLPHSAITSGSTLRLRMRR